MKKLLSVILLITAIMFTSCKEESMVRIQKNSAKKVNNLSYSFTNVQGEKDSTVKSGITTNSIKSADKVLATKLLEIDGEHFTATLIEESEPISTKAPATQLVKGSGVYTFYAYNNSAIKSQSVNPLSSTPKDRTFDVPVDVATKYGMIFLSTVDGTGVPVSTRLTLDSDKKEITYQTVFNENVCYKLFDKSNMPPENEINVITFTPVFSQIGISVPKEFDGKTINVEEFSLVSGVQKTATVKVTYNSQEVSNIVVDYAKDATTDYQPKLNFVSNATNDTTILVGRYYNIIPNGNNAKVYIKLSAGGKTLDRTIEFKDAKLNPIAFKERKRYIIKFDQILKFTIKDYYQWDAQAPYNPANYTEPFGPNLSGYNRNDYAYDSNNNPIAKYSCKDAVTCDEFQMYLGAGVYWVTDGPTYMLPNGNVHRTGLMVKKAAKITNFYAGTALKKNLATPQKGVSYQSLKDDYFFLPACGLYQYGKFTAAGTGGYYWTSTPRLNTSNLSYNLCFNGDDAFVYGYDCGHYYRDNGFVRLIDFDPTYATVQSITLSPDPLNIEPGQTGVLTATATVTLSNGNTITPTTGFKWVINPPNGVVTDADGNVQSPRQIVTGSSISNTISLKAGNYYGSTTVTVTYGGVSKTVSVNVYRDIPATRYYMWDAPVGAHFTSVYPKKNYNTITTGHATQSCKDAPTVEELKMYLGAGVYWVTDGPPFKTPNNKIYRAGLMVKKRANITNFNAGTAPKQTSVAPQKDFSTKSSTEQSQHFFLPANGYYSADPGGPFRYPNTSTNCWIGTPLRTDAYYLTSNSNVARVHYYNDIHYRGYGLLPMPRL